MLVEEVVEFEAEDEALEFVLGGGVEEGHVLVLVGGELAAHVVIVKRERSRAAMGKMWTAPLWEREVVVLLSSV